MAVASGVPRLRRCAACGCVCHRLGFPRLAGGTQGLDPRPAMRATWCLHQLEAAAAAMQRASPRMGDTLHVGLRTARGRSGADWESSTPGTAFSWTGPPPPCVGSSWLFLMCLRFHIPDVSPCVSLYHLRSAVVELRSKYPPAAWETHTSAPQAGTDGAKVFRDWRVWLVWAPVAQLLPPTESNLNAESNLRLTGRLGPTTASGSHHC